MRVIWYFIKLCVCFQIISLNRSCTHLRRSYLRLEPSCTTLYVDGCTSVWVRPHRRHMWTCHRWVEGLVMEHSCRQGWTGTEKPADIHQTHYIYYSILSHCHHTLYTSISCHTAKVHSWFRRKQSNSNDPMAESRATWYWKNSHCIIFFSCDMLRYENNFDRLLKLLYF